MPIRFRTYSLPLNRTETGLDPWWVRDASRHARFIWVRFPALTIGPSDERALIRQERALSALSGRWPCAFLSYYRTGPRSWAKVGARNVGRHRVIMQRLRESLPHPIGVVAEEVQARWFLEAGERPDLLVLDAPVIGRDELLARWFSRLDWPGYVRDSGWAAERWLEALRMDLRADELVTGLPTPLRRGQWSADRLTPEEIGACRHRLPLRESLRSPADNPEDHQ